MKNEERYLVQRILKGDSAAFRELYDAQKPGLIRACWYFLGSNPEVEDVVQEVFIKALKNLGRFRFKSSLGTWLHQIAINTCLDLLEKKKKNLPFSMEFFARQPSKEQRTPYPEEALKALREEIQNLEGRDRELVQLREIEGLSYEAIAERLKIPENTVATGLFRARQKLVEKVRARFPEWKEMME